MSEGSFGRCLPTLARREATRANVEVFPVSHLEKVSNERWDLFPVPVAVTARVLGLSDGIGSGDIKLLVAEQTWLER